MNQSQRYTIRVQIVVVEEGRSDDRLCVLGQTVDSFTVQCPRADGAEIERIALRLWEEADQTMRQLPAQLEPLPLFSLFGVAATAPEEAQA